MPWLPEDPTGDTLRELLARGDSLEQPRDIEFEMVFPVVQTANQFLATLKHLGFNAVCYHWEKQGEWHVCVYVFMRPEHEAITRMRGRLKALAEEFLGEFDGWASHVVT